MGKTKRYQPKNGEFRKLKASKQKRNKKERAKKTNLTRHLKFASEHRAVIDITEGRSAVMYMKDK